jgi:small subunit ribosomal protein S10e
VQPNLHVVNALLSLKSKGHVREVFNWQWHYFFLTETGVTYLREYLHLPEDVVPATLKAQKAKTLGLGGGAEASSPAGRFGGREGGGRSYGEKAGAPAAGQRPRFEGGAGGYQRGGSGGFAGAPPTRA